MQSNAFGRTLYNHAITNHRAAYNTRMIFFYGVMIAYVCNNGLAKLKQPEIYPAKIYTIDIALYAYRNYLVEALAHQPFRCANVKCAQQAYGQSACFGCSVFLVSLSQRARVRARARSTYFHLATNHLSRTAISVKYRLVFVSIFIYLLGLSRAREKKLIIQVCCFHVCISHKCSHLFARQFSGCREYSM